MPAPKREKATGPRTQALDRARQGKADNSEKKKVMNDGDDTKGDTKWLGALLGQAWAPQPPGLGSDHIQAIAKRGLEHPDALSSTEIQELSASVLSFVARYGG